VDTKAHRLSVFRDGRLPDRFHNVAIGRAGISPDGVRVDGTTPLGTFHIDRIKHPPRFRVFSVSTIQGPSTRDGRSRHDEFDWTQGCIALTNDQVSRLSRWVSPGRSAAVVEVSYPGWSPFAVRDSRRPRSTRPVELRTDRPSREGAPSLPVQLTMLIGGTVSKTSPSDWIVSSTDRLFVLSAYDIGLQSFGQNSSMV
jgi:hypothetical protein